MGGFMPKKPTAGMGDPRHSAQTLFPFYLGKHETAGPRGQAAPRQQLQQCPAPSRTPWDGKLTRTQRRLFPTGLWEPTLLESPPMSSTATSPHLAAHQHTRTQISVLAYCCDESVRPQFE